MSYEVSITFNVYTFRLKTGWHLCCVFYEAYYIRFCWASMLLGTWRRLCHSYFKIIVSTVDEYATNIINDRKMHCIQKFCNNKKKQNIFNFCFSNCICCIWLVKALGIALGKTNVNIYWSYFKKNLSVLKYIKYEKKRVELLNATNKFVNVSNVTNHFFFNFSFSFTDS